MGVLPPDDTVEVETLHPTSTKLNIKVQGDHTFDHKNAGRWVSGYAL
jgi:hypothetical protein